MVTNFRARFGNAQLIAFGVVALVMAGVSEVLSFPSSGTVSGLLIAAGVLALILGISRQVRVFPRPGAVALPQEAFRWTEMAGVLGFAVVTAASLYGMMYAVSQVWVPVALLAFTLFAFFIWSMSRGEYRLAGRLTPRQLIVSMWAAMTLLLGGEALLQLHYALAALGSILAAMGFMVWSLARFILRRAPR
ncbi:MAG: hypothetical protein GIW95_06245 [Candidatus Eremiobacteraeota bacterium]|nr:hypothetical protein [Candidatus Eremiobacteraeota bacterium]